MPDAAPEPITDWLTPNDELTGADLKAIRIEIGWSAVQLANKVHRTEGWIRRIESDKIPVPSVLREFLVETVEAIRRIPPPQFG